MKLMKKEMLQALYDNWATNNKHQFKDFHILQAIRQLVDKYGDEEESCKK